MAAVLVLYETVEGQTERVAQRIAAELRASGHTARLQRFVPGLQLAQADAVVVGASVHYSRLPPDFAAWLARQYPALDERPSAFFSVSLSGGGPSARPAAAQRYTDDFLKRARWRPALTAAFGGALLYSVYPWWKKQLVRAFVAAAGGDTDTRRDYEYTDWEAVAGFARAFAGRLGATA